MAQWLRRCTAEPKDVGTIPSRGGPLSGGGEHAHVFEILTHVTGPQVVKIFPQLSNTGHLITCVVAVH